jgi:tetratricopeptide (TPR) repeat protein
MIEAPSSTLRLWIFRLIAVVLIPLLFILCLEGGLRILNVGQSLNFTSECSVEGNDSFCDNTRFIERFFPKDIARQPVSFAYPKDKATNTFRIFVLGASAAQGDPEFSYGFSRILKLLLREKFPEINFEIINTSISATNSHVVLPIAKEVSQHQPDLAIVYLGNNEVVGPFGAGTIFAPIAANRSLIQVGIFLKTTRIGQIIDSVATQLKGQKNPGEWRGMEMFLGNQVRFDAAELETVYNHYQDNLFDIINTFSRQQTPVIVSTVATNIKDFPPLGSQHAPELSVSDLKQWEKLFQVGFEQFETGNFTVALKKWINAEQIDDQYAELQFLIGQAHLGMNNIGEAKQRFMTARDLDTLRFRADSRINSIIRETVDQFNKRTISLVDTEEKFNHLSPKNIAGNELFYEHVHLTFHGNYLLARDFSEQISKYIANAGVISETKGKIPSEQECEQLLALGPFDQLRLNRLILGRMSDPPFIDQLRSIERVKKLTKEYSQLQSDLTIVAMAETDSLYRQAITASPGDPWLKLNYGVFLRDQKKLTAAIEQFTQALKKLPKSYKIHRHLSESFIAIGRWEKALIHYQEALSRTRVTVDRTKLHLALAYALANLKRFNESMKTYQKALEEDPGSGDDIYHAMGKLKISIGELPEARELLKRAIEQQNSGKKTADLYFNYGYVLSQMNESDQAKDAYQKALDIYGKELAKATDAKSRESLLIVLGRSSFNIGQVQEGTDYLQQAIAINPAEINHHLTLITALARHKQNAQAKLFLSQAKQHMQSTGNNEALRQLKAIEIQLR